MSIYLALLIRSSYSNVYPFLFSPFLSCRSSHLFLSFNPYIFFWKIDFVFLFDVRYVHTKSQENHFSLFFFPLLYSFGTTRFYRSISVSLPLNDVCSLAHRLLWSSYSAQKYIFMLSILWNNFRMVMCGDCYTIVPNTKTKTTTKKNLL